VELTNDILFLSSFQIYLRPKYYFLIRRRFFQQMKKYKFQFTHLFLKCSFTYSEIILKLKLNDVSCFDHIWPSSGNWSLVNTAKLYCFISQNIPILFISVIYSLKIFVWDPHLWFLALLSSYGVSFLYVNCNILMPFITVNLLSK
jgi:hypothetical protein